MRPALPQTNMPSNSQTAQDIALLRGLAGMHICYGRYPDAESLLGLVLWLAPLDKSAHVMMARVLVRQRRIVEARDHMDKARKGSVNV
jgi:Flp pilus assembly protein TadD